MLIALFLISGILLAVAYRYYGSFLNRRCRIDSGRITPACKINDGVDYVPTRASVLFGHHFSSIAGAGPIVGPVIAAAAFGWAPALVWIILGSIFVGGVHDFGSTIMSIRYRGRSIIETCRKLVGETTGKLFLFFVLLALIYVVIVFLDLTAASFTTQPAVATSSAWFIIVALVFGYCIRKTKLSFSILVPIFIIVTYAGLWIGHAFPLEGVSKSFWITSVIIYCYLAAILPVNVLMQPRDFLSATFLYALMVLGIVGVFAKGGGVTLPAYIGFESEKLGYMVPFLFITVACGACSGFHSMVGSGTTSKQIKNEKDVKKVAYGAMLVEGFLAVFALACVAVLGGLDGSPINTFASGASTFFSALGIPSDWGIIFAMLAVSTFLLTTLDTCTRLTRFLLEELFEWHGNGSRFIGTALVLLIPAIASLKTFAGPNGEVMPVWRAIWPLFGATNQLLAALALVTFVVYLKDRSTPYKFALIPAAIMIVMPMTALVSMTFQYGPFSLLGSISFGMFLLGLYVVVMSLKFVIKPRLAVEGVGA